MLYTCTIVKVKSADQDINAGQVQRETEREVECMKAADITWLGALFDAGCWVADTDAGVCGGLVPTLNGCCSLGSSTLVIEWTDGGRPILSLPAPAARLLAGVFGVLGVCSGEGCGKEVGEDSACIRVYNTKSKKASWIWKPGKIKQFSRLTYWNIVYLCDLD